jgi:hypothetical protein
MKICGLLSVLAFAMAAPSIAQSSDIAGKILRAVEETYLERIDDNRRQHRNCTVSFVQGVLRRSNEPADAIVGAAFHECRKLEMEFRELLISGPEPIPSVVREEIITRRRQAIRDELLANIVRFR